MFKILDNFSERLHRLSDILLTSDGKTDIKTVLGLLDISEKTLREDITFINENWGYIFQIDISDTGEISAPRISISSFSKLQPKILINSVSIRFFKTLFFHPHQKIGFYTEQLHISTSTFYKYLHLLNERMASYDIEIKNEQSNYFIYSKKEMSVRQFVAIFFLEVSGYSTKLFLENQKNRLLRNRIVENYSYNNESTTQVNIAFYSKMYLISLERESQGFHIDDSSSFIGKTAPLTSEETALFNQFYPNLTMTHIKSIEESILSLRHSLNGYTDSHLEETIPFFLASIFDNFQLDKSREEFSFLLTYIKDLYINKLFVGVPYFLIHNNYAYFSHEARKNNKWTISEITFLVNDLSINTGQDFSEYLHHIIFMLVTQLPEIMENKYQQHVLIVSENSKKHAEFLLRCIKGELTTESISFDHVHCIDEASIETVDIDLYSLIITNSTSIHQNYKAILVNSFPSDYDIDVIKNYILD